MTETTDEPVELTDEQARAAAEANAPSQGFQSSADRIAYANPAHSLYVHGVVDTTGTGAGNLSSVEDLSPLFAAHKEAAVAAAEAAEEGENAIETPLPEIEPDPVPPSAPMVAGERDEVVEEEPVVEEEETSESSA